MMPPGPTFTLAPGTPGTWFAVCAYCPEPQAVMVANAAMPASTVVAAGRSRRGPGRLKRRLMRLAVTSDLLDHRQTEYSVTAPIGAEPETPQCQHCRYVDGSA